MHHRSKARSFFSLPWALLLATSGACSGGGESASGEPATAEATAKVLDLATFPLAKGAEEPQYRRLAGLSYNAPGKVQDVFEFQRQQLISQRWRELPGGYASDQAASGMFARAGYTISVMVSPAGMAGAVNVTITNHGNTTLDKLPIPAGAKPFFSTPLNASYVTEAPVAETAEACRKLLSEKGWQSHGTAGDVQFFKQNCVRLAARVASAPAQGGKTVIDYSATLMSVDLPVPADTEGLRYADAPTQLFFDTTAQQQDVIDFYRKALATGAWKSTTTNPVKIDFKELLIFRNPREELLELEMTEVDGKSRILLRFQSAGEVDALDARVEAEQKRRKMEADKPLPKFSVTLPAGAKDVKHTMTRIEFTLPTGKARAAVEAWRKELASGGWKEEVTALEDMAGSVAFKKGNQNLSVMYDDTGVLPAEVTLQARGVELERAAAPQ